MTLQITIRPETENDYAAIQRVNDLAFDRPEEGILVENLRQLPDFDPHLSLVTELKGKIIGHALFFPISIQSPSSLVGVPFGHGKGVGVREESYPCLSLGPIAVIPKYQKQGIGSQLIEAGHRTALELGYTCVVLLGYPSYYPRFGYLPAEKWDITNPWNIAGDSWMAIELVEGALEGKAGEVIYPETFNEAA